MNHCIIIRVSLLLNNCVKNNFREEFMKFLYFGDIGIIFCVVQFLILSKIKKSWIKWFPMAVTIAGLLFCLILYLNVFWTNSPSVISENQYFALFLLKPVSLSFIGCLLGCIIYKLCNRFYKQC